MTGRMILLLALLAAPASGSSWCWVGDVLTEPCPQLAAAWAGEDLLVTAQVVGVAQIPGARQETAFLNVWESSVRQQVWHRWADAPVGSATTLRWRAPALWWECELQCVVVVARQHVVVWTVIAGPPPCDAFPLSVELHGIVDGVQVVEACRWISFDGTVASTGRLALRAPEVRLLSGARVLTGGRLEVGR